MLVDKINKNDKDLIFVYTTCSGKEEARAIAYASIGERLAASSDFWEINSIYPWQGVLEEGFQYMLVLTTQKVLADKLIRYIETIHSYAVPMIVESDIKNSSQAYRFWVAETLESHKDFILPSEDKKRRASEAEGEYHPGHLK